tara:strand:- start:61 stop:237 length:177 start_codon:yes stop_codon:yes gene_type:complete
MVMAVPVDVGAEFTLVRLRIWLLKPPARELVVKAGFENKAGNDGGFVRAVPSYREACI